MFAKEGPNMAGKNVNSFFETWQVQDGDPKRNFVPAKTEQFTRTRL